MQVVDQKHPMNLDTNFICLEMSALFISHVKVKLTLYKTNLKMLQLEFDVSFLLMKLLNLIRRRLLFLLNQALWETPMYSFNRFVEISRLILNRKLNFV